MGPGASIVKSQVRGSNITANGKAVLRLRYKHSSGIDFLPSVLPFSSVNSYPYEY